MSDTANECKNHLITLDNRKQITVSGVMDIIEFDEMNIVLQTEGGRLFIEGSDLQITVLDVESGRFCATGRIDSLTYSDKTQNKRRGLFGVFRNE